MYVGKSKKMHANPLRAAPFLAGLGAVFAMASPDAQATEFFKKPTTIRFHLAGTARFVGFASVSYGLRLVGD